MGDCSSRAWAGMAITVSDFGAPTPEIWLIRYGIPATSGSRVRDRTCEHTRQPDRSRAVAMFCLPSVASGHAPDRVYSYFAGLGVGSNESSRYRSQHLKSYSVRLPPSKRSDQQPRSERTTLRPHVNPHCEDRSAESLTYVIYTCAT